MKEDSLKKRYLYKLIVSFIIVIVSLILQAVVPRALGPATFGDFIFLTVFFTSVINFLELGSSSAFYVRLCQTPRDQLVLKFYSLFSVLFFCVLFLFLCLSFWYKKNNYFWPNQNFNFVCFALIFSFMTWCSQIVLKVFDAHGMTRDGELLRLFQKVLLLIFVIYLFWKHRLDLASYYLIQNSVLLLGLFAWWFYLNKKRVLLKGGVRLTFFHIRDQISGYFHFCAPLFIISFFSLVFDLGDRWLVQHISGASQQGFYGLAYQMASVCFLFSSSIIQLLGREFAVAFSEKNTDKMRHYFFKHVPLVFVITTFFSVFVSVNSNSLVLIFGGEKYAGAVGVAFVVGLLPIHQTYSQICASYLISTNKANIYCRISLIALAVGFCFSFFFYFSSLLSWKNNGALALSIKVVAIQSLTVVLMLRVICNELKLSFKKNIYQQLVVTLTFISFALLYRFLFKYIGCSLVSQFMLSGVCYTVTVFLCLLRLPRVFFFYSEYADYIKLLINKTTRLKL